jgi:protein-disulfide isomerase
MIKIICMIISIMFFLGSTKQSYGTEGSDKDTVGIVWQLSEIMKEIRALRNEVKELDKIVTEMNRRIFEVTEAAQPEPSGPKNVNLGNGPVMGSSEALVAIVEFSDYQCPFCFRFHSQSFANLKKNYIDTGKVKYAFRDFPLDFHAEGKKAAIAANCAGKQKAFWEMQHALFNNQRRLGPDLYKELSKNLGLDTNAFNSCLEDPLQEKEVNANLAYGISLGVKGTPNFFVGRVDGKQIVDVKQISGAQPLAVFEQTIDSFLK